MPRPEPGEPSSESEDEYEVEFIYGARWTESGWEYEVHWYGYDTQYDTWEPEANLTQYGSADLVNRFWKEFPKKRNSRPIPGTKYTAAAKWLVAERERFLSRRQKDEPVKSRGAATRKSGRQPVALQGDSESESQEGSSTDDEDVLHSSSDRDDEDVLQSSSSSSSSSSEDAPLSARRPSATTSDVGLNSGVTLQTQAERRRKPFQSVKSNTRPQLKGSTTSRTPAASSKPSSTSKGHASTASQIGTTASTSTTPEVRKVATISKEPIPAGNISGSFVGIGTKGKQAERAGEVIALGRKSQDRAPGPSNMYAGMSMRKTAQHPANPGNSVPPVETAGSEHIVVSPIEVSPTEQGPWPLRNRTKTSMRAPGDFSHMDVDLPEFDDPRLLPLNVTRGSVDGPLSLEHLLGASPMVANAPQQIATRVWTGELYITTSETDLDNGNIAKDVANRACEVIISDTVIPNEQTAKNFKGILNKYIKDKMTIPSVMDINLSFAIIASGALSVYQAAWMTCTDPQGSSEWQTWDGLIHKMEVYLWVSEIRIMASNNNEFSQRLLLIPITLLRKYRNLPALSGICEYFKDQAYAQTPSFVVLMLKKEVGSLSDEEEPPPIQVSQLPKYWQQIPPEMKPSFAGVNCLVFPSREFDHDYEVRLMRHQLRQCGAHVIEGGDPKDTAGAIFIHRRYMDNIAGLAGLSLRKCKYRIRFYVYGSGGNWKTADWELKEIWKWGGMVTFTPAALIEDPWTVKKVVEALEGKPFWETYIEPKTIGILSLNARKAQESEYAFLALDVLMTELVTSTEFAFYNLALTAPPKWGLLEEYEWAQAQVERTFIQDGDELRKSCEDEILEEYKELAKASLEKEEEIKKAEVERKKKEAEAKRKEKENASSGWGNNGWGLEVVGVVAIVVRPWGTGANDNPWGNPSESNNDPWRVEASSASATTAAKPAEIDSPRWVTRIISQT
ncbi:Chromatin organization modifier domain [Rhizoctonia solani]|uniref:Chromatin organization modifier domain n=1 Tax=Rhizoctonia solani TaxID=456999 RepID=A0A8H7I9E5_9AGAM|nr:Chromatin organization modifier domain [Rhizoctonia solani]